MSIPFAAVDAATIASLNKGEERALEQIFRSHYDVLLERATDRLKDEPSAAPRVVSAAIRELWEERQGFHTSAEIEGFFNEEFRHRARAVRSRMAAVHRFEKSEGVAAHAAAAAPSADKLWGEIAAALHAPILDPAAASKRRREHAAHDAAHHIANVSAPRSFRTAIIVGTVGAVCLIGGYLWAEKASARAAVTQMLVATDATTVVTKPGQLGSLTLGDSSTVRLGAESKIVVVAKFGREYRAASASGSVAINVKEGNKQALEVRMGDVSVQASAGEFAVRDFADEPARYVTAKSDGIRVTVPTSDRTLKAGETVAIVRGGALRDATADEAAQAFSWLDGKLVLRDVTVGDARHELWRWYGIDVKIDSSLFARRLSVDVPLESSQAAIAAFEGGGGLRFAWVDNRMTLQDASKPLPTKARRSR